MHSSFENINISDASEIYLDNKPVGVKSCSFAGDNDEFVDITLIDGRIVRTCSDNFADSANYYVKERFYLPNSPRNGYEAAEALREFDAFIENATLIYRTENFNACIIGEGVEELWGHQVSFHQENYLVDDGDFPVFDADPYNRDGWVFIREHREDLQRMIDEDEDEG